MPANKKTAPSEKDSFYVFMSYPETLANLGLEEGGGRLFFPLCIIQGETTANAVADILVQDTDEPVLFSISPRKEWPEKSRIYLDSSIVCFNEESLSDNPFFAKMHRLVEIVIKALKKNNELEAPSHAAPAPTQPAQQAKPNSKNKLSLSARKAAAVGLALKQPELTDKELAIQCGLPPEYLTPGRFPELCRQIENARQSAAAPNLSRQNACGRRKTKPPEERKNDFES